MRWNSLLGVRLSIGVLVLYIFIAIFAPIIANDRPLFCHQDDQFFFPFLSKSIKNYDSHKCIWPIVSYGPQTTNIQGHSSLSPCSTPKMGTLFIHWLGTDKLGRDAAAGLIHGTKVSLMIGFLSVFFTFLIGTSLGMLAPFFGAKGLAFNVIQYILSGIGIFLSGFYFIFEWMSDSEIYLALISALIVLLVFLSLSYYIGKVMKSLKKYPLDLDSILMKFISWRKSFPGIFLLLALTGIFVIPSIWNIVFIITILGWTEFARHARAETLSIMEENYIISAKILGFSDLRILFKHILPNIMPTMIVLICFSTSGAILAESTISFLGIGLPVETVTWGKIMASGRDMNQWWLVVFPGLAIMLIILSLNTIANHYLRKNRTNQ